MILHKGHCVSGGLVIQAEDGVETQSGPGDGYVIEPGHDAWVTNNEPTLRSKSQNRWLSTRSPSRSRRVLISFVGAGKSARCAS